MSISEFPKQEKQINSNIPGNVTSKSISKSCNEYRLLSAVKEEEKNVLK